MIATSSGVISIYLLLSSSGNTVPKIISIPKVEEKEEVITVPNENGTTYYHVTTPEAAASIASSGIMIGSAWEGGYVYAWKFKPNNYAIKNSGAHQGVVISFKTNAVFSPDPGIIDPKIRIFAPVRASGPIQVWDVKIME